MIAGQPLEAGLVVTFGHPLAIGNPLATELVSKRDHLVAGCSLVTELVVTFGTPLATGQLV